MPADIVVSNGDTAWTYKNLVAPQHRRVWTDRKIANGKYSMGLFVWYFGTSRQYQDVPHHMMVLGPRYKGLLTDIFKHKVLDNRHRPPGTDDHTIAWLILARQIQLPICQQGTDIPERESGWICSPTVSDVARTLKQAMSTPMPTLQAMGHAGWSWMKSSFDLPVVARQMNDCYEELGHA